MLFVSKEHLGIFIYIYTPLEVPQGNTYIMRFRQTILMIFAAIAAVFGIIVNALLFTGFVVTTNTQRLEQQSALVLLYPVLLQEQQQQPKQQPEHHAHAHARQLYIYHYNNSNIIDAASIIDTTTSSTPPQAQSAHHQMQYHHDKLMFVHIGKTGGETLKHHLRVTCTTRGDAAKRNKCYKKWQAIAQTNNNNNETTNQTTNIIRHESEISQRTVAIMHCNLLQPPNSARGSGGPQDPITSHLFCLRSPVDRILSWFRYIHPNGCRKIRHDTPNCASKRHMVQGNNTLVTTFARCFPTLLHFLNSLGPPISSPSTTTAVTSNVSNNSSRHLEVCAQTAHAILQATSRNVSIM